MDTVIRFRVATMDHEQFKAAAKRDGLSLSSWMRMRLLRASHFAEGDTFSPAETKKLVAQKAPPLEPNRLPPLDEKSKVIKRQAESVLMAPKPLGSIPGKPLTREERDAKIDAFQRKMGKK